MRADHGLEIVAHLRDVFDARATAGESPPRGFAWTTGVSSQHVWADQVRPDGCVRVQAEAILVRGMNGDGATFAALARHNAADPGLSALRWNGETGDLSLRAAVLAHAGDWPDAARRLAHAALLQVCDAARLAPGLAAELGGVRACIEGEDSVSDPLVEAWREYARAGESPSPLLGDPMRAMLVLEPRPWRAANGSERGFDAELPSPAPGGGAALLRMLAAQPHPRLGSGLLVVLQPPAELVPAAERGPATASLLNEGESREWTGTDQCGAWCVHAAQGLAHVAFVPALACEPTTPERLAWQAAQRSRWLPGFLARVQRARETPH